MKEYASREHGWPRPRLSVSEWADQSRYLNRFTSAEPGKWRTARAAYQREIMDSFSDPLVEDITVCSASQVGKTEIILNCMGYVVDQCPSPTMVVLPRDDDAKDWAAKRVKPMIQASGDLWKHTTGLEDDLAGKLFRFDRMFLKFAGANSPADLSSDPCKFVFFDEVDKYPRFSGREADPVKLGSERTRTFWNSKKMKVSTPTVRSGYITRELERSDKRRFWVPCPRCGAYQPLVFSREQEQGRGELRWPKGASPEDIRKGRLAYYECGYCQAKINESAKSQMVTGGVWCPDEASVIEGGKINGQGRQGDRRGYQLSALYSPWVSWSVIAAEFLESKDNPPLLMAFVNSVLGEPWTERTQETKGHHIKSRESNYAMGEVPQGVQVLTAGVDVQKDHYWFVIRGWGLGEESWLIRFGRIEAEADLVEIVMHTEYRKEGGRGLRPRVTCVDSAFRTNEVYALCRRFKEAMRPIKGFRHQIAAPFKASHLDRDSKGKQMVGGLTLWTLDTNYYKDKLNRLIHAEPEGAGKWHLCEEVGEEYVAQLSSEHKVIERDRKTGKVTEAWRPVTERRATHLLDCEVYALLGADMLKVYLLREAGGQTVYRPRRRTISSGLE